MGTRPVHVLGLVLLTGTLASGCRSGGSGGGNAPGMIGNNTNSQSAFGRDPGLIANAPSSMKPATNGVNPQVVYGNDTNPMAPSGSAPGGTVRDYSNGVSVADNDVMTNRRPAGWTSSPRANTMVPPGGTTSASMTGAPTPGGNPAPGMSGTTSAGLAPVNYQPPPGAMPTSYPRSTASAFPSNGQDSFKDQPTMSSPSMTPTSNASGNTMSFSPTGGTTSGDVGRTTPTPTVDGLPSNGGFHSVPSAGMPGQQ